MTTHFLTDKDRPTANRLTGSTTTGYPSAHTLVWDHLGTKTLIIACDHASNDIKYKISSYAYPGSSYFTATRTEVTLVHGNYTAFEIPAYAQVILDAKSNVADTAGYHTSGTNPLLTLVSLASAGYHTGGESPAITLVPVAGYHKSGLNPSINISAGTDNKFKIQADAEGSATTVTLDESACTTGAATAAEMQTKIQALGGAYAAVTVSYTGTSPTNYYTITSGTTGSGSQVTITAGTTNDVSDDLKIGTLGTSTAGITYDTNFKIQGDADSSARAVSLTAASCTNGANTAAEMQSKIRAIGGIYAAVTVAYSTHYLITSGTVGNASKVRITAGATADVADNLKIGTANGGTNTDGIGNATFKIQGDSESSASTVTVDTGACTSGATTAAEMQTKIQALGGAYAAVTVAYVGTPVTDTYLITSGTAGASSAVTITNGTTNNCATALKIGSGGTSTAGTSTPSSYVIEYAGA